MRKLFQVKALPLFAIALLTSMFALAQEKPIASPRETVTGTVAGATVTISYGSPAVKGRKIWGGLVPYDKMWRTGANQATTIELSKAVKIEGKSVPAGKYTLFTTPSEKSWQVTVNSQTGQWGIKDNGMANEDPAKDVAVVSVSPMKSTAFNERLTFKITKTGFVLLWENLAVPVKID